MTSTALDEEQLVEAMAAGDLTAFTRVYGAYHGFVFHFAVKFLKSTFLAEEVVNDVFLKLWENRSQLVPGQSLKAYLATVCKNHVFNLLKKAKRESAIMEEIRRLVAVARNQTEEDLFGAELEQVIDQIVSQLPEQRQRIFRMYRFEELDLDAIAGKLHISKGTAKDHMVRANRFVRKNLKVKTGISFCTLLVLLFTLP